MDTNYLENNYLTLVGKVTGEKKFSHEIYGERFYVFNLEIARLSGNADIIPITVSERLVTDEMLAQGKNLLVKGQFRSYNSYENEKNRLILTVFAKDVVEVEEPEEQEENDHAGFRLTGVAHTPESAFSGRTYGTVRHETRPRGCNHSGW